MLHDFRLFGSIAKVEEQDDGTIKVYGVASSGGRDTAGEVILPDAMKAALPDYSRFPALREMHQPQAAGKVLEAAVNDNGETDIVALVVDPVAIKKVKTGVYAAFSIGGKVTKRDPGDRTVITGLRLVEISLVDSPCNPDAVLSMWKADAIMATEFKPEGADVIARAKQLAKAAGTQRFKEFLFEASQELCSEHELAKGDLVEPEPVQAEDDLDAGETEKEAVAEGDPNDPPADDDEPVEEGEEVKEAAAEGDEITAEEPTADPAAALEAAIESGLEKAKSKDDEPYGDVEYADPGYQDDKKKRYPLDTEEHIRAAWNYIHKQSNRDKYTADQCSKIEAKIVAAWKSKIDKDGPPSAEKTALVADLAKTAAALKCIGVDLSKLGDDAVANQATADALGITKSLYSVASLAGILDQLAWLASNIQWEEAYEGDETSMVPTALAACVRALGEQLVTYAQEEIAEVVASLTGNDSVEIVYVGDDCEYAAAVVDLTKADEVLMAKAGARHSKADKAAIQQAHDAMTKLGASCAIENCDKAAEIAAENESLKKIVGEAAPKVEELTASFTDTIDTLKSEIADLRKRFDDEPLPPKTAGPAVIAKPVEKGADSSGNGGSGEAVAMTQEDFEKRWNELPDAERGQIMLRLALANPQLIVPQPR